MGISATLVVALVAGLAWWSHMLGEAEEAYGSTPTLGTQYEPTTTDERYCMRITDVVPRARASFWGEVYLERSLPWSEIRVTYQALGEAPVDPETPTGDVTVGNTLCPFPAGARVTVIYLPEDRIIRSEDVG